MAGDWTLPYWLLQASGRVHHVLCSGVCMQDTCNICVHWIQIQQQLSSKWWLWSLSLDTRTMDQVLNTRWVKTLCLASWEFCTPTSRLLCQGSTISRPLWYVIKLHCDMMRCQRWYHGWWSIWNSTWHHLLFCLQAHWPKTKAGCNLTSKLSESQ